MLQRVPIPLSAAVVDSAGARHASHRSDWLRPFNFTFGLLIGKSTHEEPAWAICRVQGWQGTSVYNHHLLPLCQY